MSADDSRPVDEPGERPPARSADGRTSGGRLAVPPSARYGPARTGEHGPASSPGSGGRANLAGPVAGSLLIAAVGAALLTFLVAGLTSTTGTILVSVVAGAAIGLVAAGAAISDVPGREASLSRPATVRLGVAIAIGMVVVAALAIWLVGRAEGGVMDPLSYLWTTFGFGIPALGVVAALAAAWGAANGPVRGR